MAGVATVLSFASIAELFAKEGLGRANAALNLLHVGSAFLIQCLTGFVVALWPEQSGHHPAIAYQIAFAVNLALQVGALAWFLLTSQVSNVPVFRAHAIHTQSVARTRCPSAAAGYERAIHMWMVRVNAARHQVAAWRAAAIASAALMLALSGSFAQALAAQRMVAVHFVQQSDSFETGLLPRNGSKSAPVWSRSTNGYDRTEKGTINGSALAVPIAGQQIVKACR